MNEAKVKLWLVFELVGRSDAEKNFRYSNSAGAGVRSIFREPQVRKHQPHSYNTLRLFKLKEERRKAPTGDGISQIHSDC